MKRLHRALNDEQVDLANYLKLRKPTYIATLAKRAGKSISETTRIADELCKIGVTEYNPDFDWCMPIGKYADYLVRVGKAKRVTTGRVPRAASGGR